MLHHHAVSLAVVIHKTEPLLYPRKKFHLTAELAKILTGELDSPGLCFIEHQFHITEYIAGILTNGYVITFAPEFLRALAYGLDESELLHISRRKGSVEIVNKGDYRFFSHNCRIRKG